MAAGRGEGGAAPQLPGVDGPGTPLGVPQCVPSSHEVAGVQPPQLPHGERLHHQALHTGASRAPTWKTQAGRRPCGISKLTDLSMYPHLREFKITSRTILSTSLSPLKQHVTCCLHGK